MTVTEKHIMANVHINTVSPLISRLVNEAVPLADQVYV